MGKNSKRKVLRIRFRDFNGLPQSRLVFSSNSKNLGSAFSKGRVLKVGKVSNEELFHTGAYNKLPETLMREFRQGGKRNVAWDQVNRELQESRQEV